jgi:hypothetical protein
MAEVVRFELEGGGSVLVEMGGGEPGIVRASRLSEVARTAQVSFEAALAGVRDAAASALRTFRDIPQPPDEVAVEFGVELNAQAGALIAQAGASSHLQVTLTWKRPVPGDPAGARDHVNSASSG